ncbi:MAG: hypothetical protein JSW06_07835 [Thermoplasmatales archaeon]|nr:MAG: hypothetical protein JSW06_07835 [Thermoplasmatales archaeon]
MQKNRKIINNTHASHFFLSIFILVAIALFLSVAVYLYLSEIPGGVQKKFFPSVGMIQEGDHIFISGVQNGPVMNDSVIIQIINQTSGKYEGNGKINVGSDGEIKTGDTIILTGINTGTNYVVSMIHNGKTVGSCNYFYLK